jgi:parallel beta-helix repeat protein
LVVEIGPDEGKEFPLRGTMRIGRTEDNEITLADAQASRHHAAISPEPGGFSVQDLNSSNGTLVNGKKLDEPRILRDGDRLRVANTILVFRGQPDPSMAAPATPPLTPPPADYASLPTTEVSWQTPPAGVQDTPLPKAAEPKKGLPAGRIVLGAGLVVVFLAVAAVALYFFLGNSDGDKSPNNAKEKAPAAITQVVTSAPTQVVTKIVTSEPVATATVAPTATPSGPATVRVAPDGSGDYASLEQAVEAVPPGSTIHLAAGTYRLAAFLEIDKSLALRGAGMDQTFVAGTEGEQVVLFSGPGAFAAEGITFRYEGNSWGRVMNIEDAEIDIARCRFTGAVWGGQDRTGGDGLLLLGNTTGSVRDSRFEGNELHGIELQEQAQLVLEGNVAADNGQVGIRFADSTGGEAIGNESVGNGMHGISIRDQARPALEANIASDNGEVGISYTDGASGVALGNTCDRNGLHGISVQDEAHPTLEANACHDNIEVGIRFSGSAGGLARDNTSVGNGIHGFHLEEQANPTLERNTANHNVQGGIVYFGSASGVARQNECNGNKWGIYVASTAAPELIDNDCRDNSAADVEDRRQPAGPAFGPITFARDRTDANEPIDPTTTFPAGTLRVYALFDYEGMSSDLEWGRTWYRNGEEYVSKTKTWSGKESGTWSLWVFRTSGEPLVPATYELRLFIQGKQVQSATLVVTE